MALHVYELPPIDVGWDRVRTVRDTASSLGAATAAAAIDGPQAAATLEGPMPEDFLKRWDAAKQLAAKKGWEGDFRGGPVVFWVPGEYQFEYGFVFKQDNNGTTYVVSPVELPHLAEFG